MGGTIDTRQSYALPPFQVQQYQQVAGTGQGNRGDTPEALDNLIKNAAPVTNSGQTTADAVTSVTQNSSGAMQEIKDHIRNIQALADTATETGTSQPERDALRIEIEGLVKSLTQSMSGLSVEEQRVFQDTFTGSNLEAILSIDVPSSGSSETASSYESPLAAPPVSGVVAIQAEPTAIAAESGLVPANPDKAEQMNEYTRTHYDRGDHIDIIA